MHMIPLAVINYITYLMMTYESILPKKHNGRMSIREQAHVTYTRRKYQTSQ